MEDMITKSALRGHSVQFSHSVMSESLWRHGLQHTRLPCLSPTPGASSNSCPLSQWCHPTISSSVVPFSSCLQSFPASGSFPMSRFFTSGGKSIGVSASASVLPMDIQDWVVCSNPFCIVCCPWGHWRAKQQWVVPVFIHIKKWLYQLQPELFVGATLQSWHLSSGSTHSLPPPKCRCQPETPTPVSPKGRRVERDGPMEKKWRGRNQVGMGTGMVQWQEDWQKQMDAASSGYSQLKGETNSKELREQGSANTVTVLNATELFTSK